MTDPGRRRLAWVVWVVMILTYVVEVALLFMVISRRRSGGCSRWLQAMEDLARGVGTLGLHIVLSQPGNAGWWIMTAGLAIPWKV